jgi:enoyl-CoA hydratase
MSSSQGKIGGTDYSSDGNYKRILVSQDGPVRTIEMNVPEKRNPLGFPMVEELSHAIKAADADPETRVIIIGGTGEVFSGGHDLSPEGLREYVAECDTPENLWSTEEKYFFHKQGLDIWNLDKPTIARVQGAAVLGGFVLANVCDLIVAADDAIFWTPAVRMYNFCAEVFMEPWVMGGRRAKEYLFTGDPMDAQEAHRVGMVNRIVPKEELNAATMKLAQHIGKNPPLGLKMAKRAVNRTMDYQGLRNALEYNFLFHVFGHATSEFQEKVWKPLIEHVNEEGFVSYLQNRDAPFK